MSLKDSEHFVGITEHGFNAPDIAHIFARQLGITKGHLHSLMVFFREMDIFIPSQNKSTNLAGLLGGSNQIGGKKDPAETLMLRQLEARYLEGNTFIIDIVQVLGEELKEETTGDYISKKKLDIDTKNFYKSRFEKMLEGAKVLAEKSDYITLLKDEKTGVRKYPHFEKDRAQALSQALQRMDDVLSHNYTLLYCKAVLMSLSFFLSNGKDFADLSIEKKDDESIKRLIDNIPALPGNFKEALIPKVLVKDQAVELSKLVGYANLHIYGPGGAGKTTLLSYLGRTYVEKGEKVCYIRANEVNESSTPKMFVLDKIGEVFPEFNHLKPDFREKDWFSNTELFNGLLIIVDALDEIRDKQRLYDVLSVLNNIMSNTPARVIVSSRYTYSNIKVREQIKICPIDVPDVLPDDKKEIYRTLSAAKKELLKRPYFLNSFIDDRSPDVSFSGLVKSKIYRDIEKSGADTELIEALLPGFMHYLAGKTGNSFTMADINNYINIGENFNVINNYYDEEIEEQLSKLYRVENKRFFIPHTFERDYWLAVWVAVFLAGKMTKIDSILSVFSRFTFNSDVKQMLSEMLEKSIIDRLRIDNFENEEDFYTEETASATANLLELFNDDIDFTGLNLTRYTVKNAINKTFYDALVSPTTFQQTSLSSAVFSILPADKDGNVYCFGRNQMLSFNSKMQEVSSYNFASEHRAGNHIKMAARYDTGKRIAFVTVNGDSYIYNGTDVEKVLTDKKAASVICPSVTEVAFGTADGCIEVFKRGNFKTISLKFDNGEVKGDIMLIDKIQDIYLFAAGSIIYSATQDGNVKHLCDIATKSAHNGVTLRKSVKISDGRYMLLFYQYGMSILKDIIVKKDNDKIDIKPKDAAFYGRGDTVGTNDIADEQLSNSIKIDLNKITDFCIFDSKKLDKPIVFYSLNSGSLRYFNLRNTNEKYTSVDHEFEVLEYISASNFGLNQNIEAIGCHNGKLIVSTSGRQLHSVNVEVDKEDKLHFSIDKTVYGSNIGIRRLLQFENKVYALCFNNSIVELENDNGQLVFVRKTRVDADEPVWCGYCTPDGDLYVGCGSGLFLIANGGAPEKIAEFDYRVENVAFDGKNNCIYVASGQKVHIVNAKYDIKTKEMVFDGKRYAIRPLCFEFTDEGNLLIGCSSGLDEKDGRQSPLIYTKVLNTDKVETIPFFSKTFFDDGSIDIKMPTKHEVSEKIMRGDTLSGWYRNIQTFDGGFTLCAGVITTAGHSALLYRGHLPEYPTKRYILAGHTNYVTQAKIIQKADDTLYIRTIAYDGFLNLYRFDKSGNYDFPVIAPLEKVKIADYNLYDFIVSDDSIFIADAAGFIHKVQFDNCEKTIMFENNNIFVQSSDLTTITIDEKSELKYKELTSLNNRI